MWLRSCVDVELSIASFLSIGFLFFVCICHQPKLLTSLVSYDSDFLMKFLYEFSVDRVVFEWKVIKTN